MPTAGELTGLQPALIRGLYGYDTEEIWSEQPHAIIYRGRRSVDGLPVLIKLLRDPGSIDWGADWLERDYQIAHDLTATCAVKPLAFEQTDRGPALIYTDDGARPLEELAAKGPPDIDTALKIGASIADAVADLHKERLIHCNLNPTTVWLSDDTGRRHALGFRLCATPFRGYGRGIPPCDDLIDVKYISPEQTGRLQNIVDQRTDIYSLGIILLRLLTGKVPFDDADPWDIIDGHIARQPVFPAHLPAGLARVILKALSKGPTPVT